MATKTFNIGESAIGGRIKVDIKGKLIQIKALDWVTRKEVQAGSCIVDDAGAERKIDNFLNELTSSYYAGKILDWIKINSNLSI